MSTRVFVSAAIALALTVAGSSQIPAAERTATELVKRSDVKFIPLNPKRGDQSPQSGRLWGNIRENETSGMLVTFADGFQSPPHIHNITYRAVVIEGAVHNDDPTAEKMWMGPGSFWTQPLGETHITAAKGANTTIFLEILSGPYLVKPATDAFDAGERPINVDAGNIVWLGAADSAWITGDGPELAYLWGETAGNEKNGTFVKLPAGYGGTLSTAARLLRVVTIQGVTHVQGSGGSDAQDLAPGSYFGSRGEASHRIACVSDEACVLYLHTEGTYRLAPR
jgi:quercetin dioxygenase-like cupin family protein